MAMASTLSTPLLKRQFLGSGIQGLRPQQSRAVQSTVIRSVSAKLNMFSEQDCKAQLDIGKNAIAGALFASLASVDSANAAQQVMQLAAELAPEESTGGGGLGDYAFLLPIIPAVAWALYNIFQPALNQLNQMRNKAVIVGLGLGGLAALGASTPQAEAAQEIATIAEGGSNGAWFFGFIVVVAAWIVFFTAFGGNTKRPSEK